MHVQFIIALQLIIINFLQAEQRLVGAGLGAPGSKMLYSSAGTYRETLKQLTKARYEGTFND